MFHFFAPIRIPLKGDSSIVANRECSAAFSSKPGSLSGNKRVYGVAVILVHLLCLITCFYYRTTAGRGFPTVMGLMPSGAEPIPSSTATIPSRVEAIPPGIGAFPPGKSLTPVGAGATPVGIEPFPDGIDPITPGKGLVPFGNWGITGGICLTTAGMMLFAYIRSGCGGTDGDRCVSFF